MARYRVPSSVRVCLWRADYCSVYSAAVISSRARVRKVSVDPSSKGSSASFTPDIITLHIA